MKSENNSNKRFFYAGIASRILYWVISGMVILGVIYAVEFYDIYQQLLQMKNEQSLLHLKKKIVHQKETIATEILNHITANLESFQFIDVFETIDQMVKHDKTIIDASLIDSNGYIHFQTVTKHGKNSLRKENISEKFHVSTAIESKMITENDELLMECRVPVTINEEQWGLIKLTFRLDEVENERKRLKKQQNFLIFSNLIWMFGVWISGIMSISIIVFIILSRHSKRLIRMGKEIRDADIGKTTVFETFAIRSDETGFLASQIQNVLDRLITKCDHSINRYDQLHESYENSSELNEKTRSLLKEVRTGLKEWEQYYRLTVNTCQESLIFLGKDGEIIEVNQAFLDITGYQMNDISGLVLIDIIPKEWKSIYQQNLLRCIYNNVEPSPVEIAIRKRDHTLLYLSVSGRLCKKQNNTFHKIILSGTNTTSNKYIQHMLKDLEYLLQSDIKNAIGRIIGLSELMTAKTQVGKNELMEWSGIIHQNARKMLEKIQQFLDFFKIEVGKYDLTYRICNLTQMFQKLETDYSSLILSKSIQIQYILNEKPMDWEQDIEIWGDCNLLYAMFSRLIEDILTRSENNQKMTISCYQKRDFHMNIRSDVDILEYDYHSFFSRSMEDSPYRKGAYIAMLIAKAHGGTIGIRANKDQQTQIILILPGKKTVVWKECQLMQLKILIADDSPNNQILLKHYLSEDTQWTCDFASNGQEALELFSTNEYDLIFMDIEMPVMDGFSAIKAIREIEQTKGCERNRSVCIVALSADSSDETRTKANEYGSNIFLSKPVEQKALIDTIIKGILGDRFERTS